MVGHPLDVQLGSRRNPWCASPPMAHDGCPPFPKSHKNLREVPGRSSRGPRGPRGLAHSGLPWCCGRASQLTRSDPRARLSLSLSLRACSEKMARLLLVLVLTLPGLGGECPARDALAQEEEGRLCGPPCAPDRPCRHAGKVCACDEPCGSVCLDPALRCPAPAAPLNGRLTVPPDTPLHAEAHYECEPGFVLEGPSVRRCRGDSSWTASEPTCQPDPFQCAGQDLGAARPAWALLPRNPHVFYANGQAVPFICSRAARLSSGRQGSLKCVQGRWQLKRGECRPRTCPPLQDLAHGRSEGHEGGQAHFSCQEGFRLVGSANATCLAGEWVFARGRPFCHPDEFEDDDDFVALEAPSTDPPVEVAPTAPAIVAWQPVPVEPVPVPSRGGRCAVPHAPHLLVSAAPNQHLVANGTRLAFSCPDARLFFFSGSRQRACLAGQWTGTPASCSPVNPGQAQSPPGLAVRAEHPSGDAHLQTQEDGSMQVLLGTHLHVDCFWPRIPDTPDPEWTHPSPRELDAFQQAWDARGERFTLTVWNLQEEDGGWYTCAPVEGTPHALRIQVGRPNEQTLEEISVDDVTACLFTRSPNIMAWSRGRWLQAKDVVPDQATVHMHCKDPGRYILQGANVASCHQGQWTSEMEGVACHLLVRDSEHSPPPIAWHSSHPTAILHDGSLLVPPGATLTLDCLWVMAEPGHGWYHPVWVREGQELHDQVQLPAEIVALSGPSPSGTPLHYAYRLHVILTPPQRPLLFTCLTPSDARHTLRLRPTAFCALETLPDAWRVPPETRQPFLAAGQSLPVALPGCATPSHVTCQQNGAWGPRAPPTCPSA